MTPLGVHWDDLPQLRDRAVSALAAGPAPAPQLAQHIFGFRSAPPSLAASLVREVLRGDPRFQTGGRGWLLCEGRGSYGSLLLAEMDFVVVDVEATGGSPAQGDRLTEVAAVRLRGGRVVESFESLVNPDRPIPPAVMALTAISQEMVAGAPRFTELVEPLRAMLEGAVFVAHNVSFDWRFLAAEFERCRGGRLGGERLCTLRLARRLHPELGRSNLSTLADYYSLSNECWHRAGPDARTTAELFIRFLDRLGDEGVEDWGCLQAYLAGPGAAAAADVAEWEEDGEQLELM